MFFLGGNGLGVVDVFAGERGMEDPSRDRSSLQQDVRQRNAFPPPHPFSAQANGPSPQNLGHHEVSRVAGGLGSGRQLHAPLPTQSMPPSAGPFAAQIPSLAPGYDVHHAQEGGMLLS